MPVILHNPAGVFPPYRCYSHAAEIRGDARTLIVSGLNGYLPDGQSIPESFEEQGDRIWQHLGTILRSAGMTYENGVAPGVPGTPAVRRSERAVARQVSRPSPSGVDRYQLPTSGPPMEGGDGGRRRRLAMASPWTLRRALPGCLFSVVLPDDGHSAGITPFSEWSASWQRASTRSSS